MAVQHRPTTIHKEAPHTRPSGMASPTKGATSPDVMHPMHNWYQPMHGSTTHLPCTHGPCPAQLTCAAHTTFAAATTHSTPDLTALQLLTHHSLTIGTSFQRGQPTHVTLKSITTTAMATGNLCHTGPLPLHDSTKPLP